MARIDIPDHLKEEFLDFHWNKEKLWSLKKKALKTSVDRFLWLLDFPIWSDQVSTNHFTLRPSKVFSSPNKNKYHYDRILNADISYPIHTYYFKQRWYILDGVHRLSKIVYLKKEKQILVYELNDHDINLIRVKNPYQYQIKY